MADWYGSARTNYFRVKDAAAFRAWAGQASLVVFEQDGLYGIYSETHDGGWPSSIDDDESEGGVRDFDIVQELIRHAAEDEIVVCIEIGAEKLRYLTGVATAFRAGGAEPERLHLALIDIYALAEQRWGARPTEAAS